jgi:hypothetical protein
MFDYSRIATLLQLTEVNARKVVSRASKRTVEQRRQPVSIGQLRLRRTAFGSQDVENGPQVLVVTLVGPNKSRYVVVGLSGNIGPSHLVQLRLLRFYPTQGWSTVKGFAHGRNIEELAGVVAVETRGRVRTMLFHG